MKLIQKWGIGYDKTAIETGRELNVPVAITASSNAISATELTVGLMLCVYRKIPYEVDNSPQISEMTSPNHRLLSVEIRGFPVFSSHPIL
jgi:phosphoglycerate dehydrogenase-like enzyme